MTLRVALLAPMVSMMLAPGMSGAARADAAPTADRASYERLGAEVDKNFHDHVLAMWFPRAIDPSGGFYQNYGEDWTQGASDDKAIVYQARLTWVAAQASLREPAEAKTYAAAAKHGLDFMRDKMTDPQDGGIYWGLDASGAPVRGGEKHSYGISFAIYAAAGDYKATRDPDALAFAKTAYQWLDTHAHDAVNGGYYEALTRQGTPILAPIDGSGGTSDEIGTHYGCKTMNTHIHLLESLSALYDVWPDPGLRARLEEVFAIVRDKIVVEPVGCLNFVFLPDWRPLPDHDSYGHDVETAYLLTEASAILGRPDDERTWTIARRIVDHALDYGWDADNGGFYDAGGVYGGPFTTDKIWWVQAEGLNALLLMHGRFGHETPKYWDAFNKQWDFIRKRQIDYANGGWYNTVARDGTATPGKAKSDGWTEAYHQGRALMNVSTELTHLAETGKSIPGMKTTGD